VLLILLFGFVSADYLNTRDKNHCIIDLEPYQNHTGYCYHDQRQDRDECDRRLKMKDLIDGYYYDSDDKSCLLKNDLKITGLTQNQWDYLLAVLAHVMGFTMLFLIDYLAVLVVRK